MKRYLLEDGDIIAYRAAASVEEEFSWGNGDKSKNLKGDFDDVIHHMEKNLDSHALQLNGETIVCLSDEEHNWRKSVLPEYKENRKDNVKPQFLTLAREWLRENYTVYERPTLEADDVMGILSTHPTLLKGRKCIVSADKDMETIPGYWFNPDKHKKPIKVSEDRANYMHMMQTLMGDTVDNYNGCPGVGIKRATALLNGASPDDYWDLVVDMFESKGLTKEDALIQARVARICRAEDYDYKKKEVIWWRPDE